MKKEIIIDAGDNGQRISGSKKKHKLEDYVYGGKMNPKLPKK